MSIRTGHYSTGGLSLEGDLGKAFHRYRNWHKAENITCRGGKYHADFTIVFWDYYDFDTGVKGAIFWLGVRIDRWRRGRENSEFKVDGFELEWAHRYGKMREFFVLSEASTDLAWDIGEYPDFSSLVFH